MNERIDDFLSDWLDGAHENRVSRSAVSACEANESIAESLLVHGLLVDIGKRTEDKDAERVSAVMQRIDSMSEPMPRRLEGAYETPKRRRFQYRTN